MSGPFDFIGDVGTWTGGKFAGAGRGVYRGVGNAVDNITGENQANAAQDAANTQANYGKQALDLQKSIHDQNAANFQPYLQGGQQDYGNLRGQVNSGAFDSQAFNPGQGPQYQGNQSYKDPGFSLANLAQDPGYQFRLQQGLGAVENSAAAHGSLHSGNTLVGLNNYAQGFASNEAQNAFNRYSNQRDFGQQSAMQNNQQNFGQFSNQQNFGYGQQQDIYNSGVAAKKNRFNNLSDLAGYGQQSASSLAGLGQNYSNAATNTLEGIGNTQAAGRIGAATARGQLTQNLFDLGGAYLGSHGGSK